MSEVQRKAWVDNDGVMHFAVQQDVESILAYNHETRSFEKRSDWSRKIGEIPNVILEQWIKEDGVNYFALPGEEFGRLVKRRLRDPDNAWLRSTDKRF